MFICFNETYIVSLSRHFFEVAGSLMEKGVQPGILEHLPGLLLQKPHLKIQTDIRTRFSFSQKLPVQR